MSTDLSPAALRALAQEANILAGHEKRGSSDQASLQTFANVFDALADRASAVAGDDREASPEASWLAYAREHNDEFSRAEIEFADREAAISRAREEVCQIISRNLRTDQNNSHKSHLDVDKAWQEIRALPLAPSQPSSTRGVAIQDPDYEWREPDAPTPPADVDAAFQRGVDAAGQEINDLINAAGIEATDEENIAVENALKGLQIAVAAVLPGLRTRSAAPSGGE